MSSVNTIYLCVNRYQALHDPIGHATRRSVNGVLLKIFYVWLFSCLICMPPLIGWNDWPEVWSDNTPCELSAERGYIVYSASGSFFIPMGIIIFVYIKIFVNTRQRLRKRAKTSTLQPTKPAPKTLPPPAAPPSIRAATVKVTIEEEFEMVNGEPMPMIKQLKGAAEVELVNGNVKLASSDGNIEAMTSLMPTESSTDSDKKSCSNGRKHILAKVSEGINAIYVLPRERSIT
jgi:hypothetical protein